MWDHKTRAKPRLTPHEVERLLRGAERAFRRELQHMGLTVEQILTQNRSQLGQSRQHAFAALAHHTAFGSFRFRPTRSGRADLPGVNRADCRIGIAPLLVERLALIERRLTSDCRTDRQRTQFRSALVIMPMDPSNPRLVDILGAIKAGARACGISASRVDEAHHTDGAVMDTLWAALEAAELVIVDLTYERPNVYYEAGYARALRKRTLYLAERGTKIHYDVSAYPILEYENMTHLCQGVQSALSAGAPKST